MQRTKFMDLFIASRCLAPELIAGNVQDFKSLVMVIFVKLFYRGILWGEAAAGGGIDDKDHFSFVVAEVQRFTFSCSNGIIVNH